MVRGNCIKEVDGLWKAFVESWTIVWDGWDTGLPFDVLNLGF